MRTEHYPLVIDGVDVATANWQAVDQSFAQGQRRSARWLLAESEHVDAGGARGARERSTIGAQSGRRCTGRVSCAARPMRCASRRFELAAWEVHECGKPWREADADVCEAIDFCEFYAAGAVALERPHGVDVPGEENRFDTCRAAWPR